MAVPTLQHDGLQNDVFLRALLREPVPYTPVWLMRQAGRYLPEYNVTRANAGSFLNVAQNPEYATEVTLQPLNHFPLDAAILFADILLLPDAMGLGLEFRAGEGPHFAHPLKTEADVAALAVPDMARLRYVFDAVTLVRRELQGRVPLIGFAGSPWTLACYMVEGASSHDYRRVKGLLYCRPDLMHRILTVNAHATCQYLNAQIQAGAQAIMIFDSWGGVLPHHLFEDYSLAYIRQVIAGLTREHENRRVPVIVFTKGGGGWLEAIATCGADAVSLDGSVALGQARRRVADKVALQGNLDPLALAGDALTIRREVRQVIDDFGPVGAGGHIFNLGHGVPPFTSPAAIAELVDEVHTYSMAFHEPIQKPIPKNCY